MVGIELREKAGKYIKTLMDDYGVIVLPAGSNVIRLLPPLTITPDELEIGIQALAGVLARVGRSICMKQEIDRLTAH